MGKYMRDGGVKSFNFHSSPRMVPHLFKPQPQLVELAIKKFVVRGGRKRSSPDENPDILSADLTGDELAILRKYFDFMQQSAWKPSLIAFPQYQRLPTHVHRVKHSFRTTALLIDTLQAFHADTRATELTKSQNDVISAHDAACQNVQSENIQDNQTDFVVVEMIQSSSVLKVTPGRPRRTISLSQGQNDVKADESHLVLDEVQAHDERQAEDNDTHSYDQCQQPSKTCSIFLENIIENARSSSKSFVSPREEEKNISNNTGDHLDPDESQTKLEKQSKDRETDLYSLSPQVCSYSSFDKDRVTPEGHSREKSVKGSSHCCLFSEGIVRVSLDGYVIISSPPSLPLLTTVHCFGKQKESHNKGSWSREQCEVLPKLSCIEREEQRGFVIHKVGKCDRLDLDLLNDKSKDLAETLLPVPSDCIVCTPEERIRGKPSGLGDSSSTLKNLDDLSPRLNSLAEQGFIPASPTEVQPASPDHFTIYQHPTSTPPDETEGEALVPGHVSISSSSNWHLTGTDAAASVHKPPTFRRLQKAKVTSRVRFRGASANATRKPDRQKLGKQQQSLLIQEFVDDEAEVSSDAGVSTDEDEDDEECDDGFIDDRMEPTVATDAGEDPVDMMAIYRKSLLTQSPFGNESNAWSCDACPSVTPVDGKSSTSGNQFWGLPTIKKSNVVSCEQGTENSTDELRNAVNNRGPSSAATKPSDRKRRLSFAAELLKDNRVQYEFPSVSFQNEFNEEILEDRPSNCKKGKIWELQEPEELTDDLFVGLDLDALEAEAAQKARSQFPFNHKERFNSQSCTMKMPNCANVVPCQNTTSIGFSSNISVLPSFDLGIDG